MIKRHNFTVFQVLSNLILFKNIGIDLINERKKHILFHFLAYFLNTNKEKDILKTT